MGYDVPRENCHPTNFQLVKAFSVTTRRHCMRFSDPAALHLPLFDIQQASWVLRYMVYHPKVHLLFNISCPVLRTRAHKHRDEGDFPVAVLPTCPQYKTQCRASTLLTTPSHYEDSASNHPLRQMHPASHHKLRHHGASTSTSAGQANVSLNATKLSRWQQSAQLYMHSYPREILSAAEHVRIKLI
jgi:hypothetical protein